MPNCLEAARSESGRITPADTTRSPRINTAPSCSNVVFWKIVWISSFDSWASNFTPGTAKSRSSIISLASRIINAPVRCCDSSLTASTIWSIDRSASRLTRRVDRIEGSRLPRPNCSRKRRNSDWNTTDIASAAPIVNLSSTKLNSRNCSRSLSAAATINTISPRTIHSVRRSLTANNTRKVRAITNPRSKL